MHTIETFAHRCECGGENKEDDMITTEERLLRQLRPASAGCLNFKMLY